MGRRELLEKNGGIWGDMYCISLKEGVVIDDAKVRLLGIPSTRPFLIVLCFTTKASSNGYKMSCGYVKHLDLT